MSLQQYMIVGTNGVTVMKKVVLDKLFPELLQNDLLVFWGCHREKISWKRCAAGCDAASTLELVVEGR